MYLKLILVLSMSGLMPVLLAQKADPGRAEEAHQQGLRLLSTGRSEQAIAAFSEAIATGVAAPETYRERGRAYLALKHGQEAVADFNKALELEKDDPDTLKLRGDAWLMTGDPAKAVQDY